MSFLLIISWLGPVAIALWLGLWQARRPAMTPAEFCKDVGTALAFAAALIFMLHMVWLGAAMLAAEGVRELGRQALGWTALTATLWVPALVISYIIRAMRERRQ